MHYFSSSNPTEDTRDLSVTIRGCEYQVAVAGSVFSAHRLDLGTRVLLDAVPAPDPSQARTVLDLGCGWGPLTLGLAGALPDAEVWAVDVNERALDLTKKNAKRAGFTNVHAVLPEGVGADIRFDLIWSNPPIRIGKQELHDLLTHWLRRLTDDGCAYLVVAKNLGADSLAAWLTDAGYPTVKIASKKGYRILRATRA